jgi:hypothetical protein
MIRNAWHISGGEGWCANSSNRRVLVTDASGNQRVEEIRDDMGLRSDDKTGMMARLRAQGVDVSSINLTSAIDETKPSKEKPPVKYGRPESTSREFEPSNPRTRPTSRSGGSVDREESRYQPKREAKDVFPGMVLPNGLGLTSPIASVSRFSSGQRNQTVSLPRQIQPSCDPSTAPRHCPIDWKQSEQVHRHEAFRLSSILSEELSRS